MKIRKLKIKNYKIFEDIEFDFTDKNGKTLDTVIFTGINGTGKTTLLELITKILTPEIDLKKDNDFEIEIEFEAEEVKILKHEFSDKIDIDVSKDFFFREISKNNIINFCYDYFLEQNEEGKIEKNLIRETSNFHLLPEITKFLNNYKIAYFHNNIFSKKNNGELNSETLKYIDYENYEKHLEKYFDKAILQYLKSHRKLTYDDIVTKRISEINTLLESLKINTKIVDIDENKLILENLSGKKLEVKDLSAGEKQIYYRAIFLLSLNLKNSLILADEPEISLHPTWQSSLLSLYENTGENNQVFIATHSPHVLSSANPENLFILHINEENKKIEVVNMEKTGQHSKGVEPNRILNQIMNMPLRDTVTQEKIDYVARNITKEHDKEKMQNTINELVDSLGVEDPFIIRLNHQLLMIERKKSKS